MPRNNGYSFESSMKKDVKKFQKKCCKKKHSHKVLGKDLNLLSDIDNVFEAKKHYVVCRSLY